MTHLKYFSVSYKDTSDGRLNLSHPKLINYKLTSTKSQSIIDPSSNNIENFVSSVDQILSNKPDKKLKTYNSLIDPVESKKNKAKFKKKVRTKIHLNDDDESLGSSYDSLAEGDKISNLSLKRTNKNLKKKLSTRSALKSAEAVPQVKADDVSKDKPKYIYVNHALSVGELSSVLDIPAVQIIKYLFLQGISVTINQVIDIGTIELIASNYGVTINKESAPQMNSSCRKISSDSIINDTMSERRLPVVTIFGHVDHGKTTLLQAISGDQSLSQESGGITQSIQSHTIILKHQGQNRRLIFLDTPGHEAFSSMRMRTVQITDVAILVVAADDGLQPQTKEAIDYFRTHKLPFLVAINKVDKKISNVSLIKKDLAEYGIISKEWSGDVPFIEISALQKLNLDQLLISVLSLCDSQKLVANPTHSASGTVLDGYLDKHQGPMAKFLVQNGTLNTGDYVKSGEKVFKVRALLQQKSSSVSSGPSSIVHVCGMDDLLTSGNTFEVITDLKQAKKELTEYQKSTGKHTKYYKKIQSQLFTDSVVKPDDNQSTKVINIILKTDSEGTIDAILQALATLPQNKVLLNIIAAGVGQVTIQDLNLATISNAITLNFNQSAFGPKNKINTSDVQVVNFNVIYDLLDYVKHLMLELVDPEYIENKLGKAVVENIFVVSKGVVAGCVVLEGKLKLGAYIKVIRKNQLIYDGSLTSLKRVKEDVDEVAVNYDCGVMCSEFTEWRKKDTLEAYELVEQPKSL
uniref:Translation initiation factor IF-2, chloroplastic n=1 Tax=Yamadaella caenomyce TaxID=259029 RepID=A0A1G4NYV7_9FLOR|nr:Translation initiation factor 2 [Yamadaella caenomyce]SCW23804.1 Translation initiation factor 2 [Yamadaella caenomyce]